MAYYTDEDRKRAATSRQLRSLFRQLKKAPEDVYDILGKVVPKVVSKPTLQEYGLTGNIQERIKQLDEEYVTNEKKKRKFLAFIATAIFVGLCILVYRQTNEAIHPENFVDGVLINSMLGWAGGILSVGGFLGLIMLWGWAFDVKPIETSEHVKYKEYCKQLSYYEYWQRRNNKDYWNTMTGHAFENAVANLFRNVGYNAEVSAIGGDGGIDIILQKGNRRIAVQCKRYKNNVGPHIIRDLWGTMRNSGFTEGCIVTTTGFTKGVLSFAEDKDIFLLDLNDILQATAEGGDSYLKQKIGEYV